MNIMLIVSICGTISIITIAGTGIFLLRRFYNFRKDHKRKLQHWLNNGIIYAAQVQEKEKLGFENIIIRLKVDDDI